MGVKNYLLYCNYCNYKRITDGTKEQDTVEVKVSPLFISPPILDPATNKTIEAKFKKRPKRFKCLKCGRIIFPKRIKEDDQQTNSTGYQTGDEGQSV